MPSLIQPSFARGEIAPELFGRVDTNAFRVALATCRNAIIHAYGGSSNRAGTQYIGPVKTHSIAPRLIPFRFKASDTYILEFGNLYMRAIRSDAHVLEADVTITGATAANPVVVTTSGAHGYSNGDEVFISGIVGMTELNSRRLIVANVTSTTFECTDQFDGGASNVDGTAYTAYVSGGTVAKVYEIVTPFATADLEELKFTQSADVISIAHPNYPLQEVSRTGHAAWTIGPAVFQPDQARPTGITISNEGASGSTVYSYKVTAVNEENEEESLTGLGITNVSTPESATAADPVVVTDTGHPFVNGDEIELSGFVEMTEVNGRRFTVANKATNTYELEGEDGTGYTAETTGGSASETREETTSGNATLDDTNFNRITWTAAAGALRYRVYRFLNGLYGKIGETEDLQFDDTDSTTDPDFDFTPPRLREPVLGTDNYPSAVSYYEQRRVMGGSNNKPDTNWFTQIGHQNNLNVSIPGVASDAITATLNATEVNAIRHYVPLGDLIVLTNGEEWRINAGNSTSGFSRDTITQKPQTSWGSSHRRPIVVGATALYVQDDDKTIRTIGYSLQVDGYTGTDITVLAPHIFRDATLVDWSFSRNPDSIIYMTLSDGTGATLTFNEEQEVVAFTRWDTPGGSLERVAVVRPTDEIPDAGYFVVKRVINGNTVRLIEKTHPRDFTDVRDAFFVDCGLSLDVPLAISGATAADPVVITTTASHGLADGDAIDIHDIKWTPAFDSLDNESNPAQLNGGRYLINDITATTMALANEASSIYVTDITQANPGVVTTSEAHGLTTGDKIVLNGVLGMTEANNNTYTATVLTTTTFDIGVDSSAFTAYTSGGKVHATIDGSAFAAYVSGGNVYEVEDELSGLWHLEGEDVVCLADGNVIRNLTVADGAVTLPVEAGRAHIGKKFISDWETLNIEDFSAGPGTVQGRQKHIPYVTIRFFRSRGLWVGPHKDDLSEMLQREDEDMGEPTDLLTGDKQVIIPPDWNSQGRVFMRQRDPLPVTILAVVPFIEVEDD